MRDTLLINLEHALQAGQEHVVSAVMEQVKSWQHAAPQSLLAAARAIIRRYEKPTEPVVIVEAHEGGKAFVPQGHGRLGD